MSCRFLFFMVDCIHVPYFLDQMPPSNSRCPRIVAASFTHLDFIVAALELLLHFELEPIDHTHKQCPCASLAVLLASQMQKRLYDDAFKQKAMEDSEKTTNRPAARKSKVDHNIYAYSNNAMKVFVATLE